MKVVILIVLSMCSLTILLSQTTSKSNLNFTDNYTKSYISTPSKTLDGIKPEAKWIWDSGNPNPIDYYLLVRKEINLSETPQKVTAFISAYSFADVYINGKLLDRCPINCDPEFQVYEYYDITKFLKQGDNTISAVVYNYGTGMHHRLNAQAGFFFQSKIDFEKEKSINIPSDKSWKVTRALAWEETNKLRTGSGENRPNLIGFNERFNASLMPEKWQENVFNDSNWEDAHEIGIPPFVPWNNIVVVKRPVLERNISTSIRTWRANNTIIYDFGAEITASPIFEIESSREGIVVDIGTGERLNSDSTVNATKRVDFTDQYITKKGVQSWQPSTWRGFRYFYIHPNDSIKIINVSAATRNYNLEDESSFECSDTLLKKIWKIGKNTVKLCSQDTYMDTPWREQTHYIAGDARFLQKYAFYSFGGSSNFLIKYNILCGAESQRWSEEGAIRSRYPTGWLLGPNTSAYLFDYELEWIIMLGEYYKYFGDKDLVKQVYPNLVKLLGYIQKYVSVEHGLIKDAPGWIVLDHPRNYPMDLKNEITAVNCLYYAALEQAIQLAESVLNDQTNLKKWKEQANELRTNIRKWLWSEKNKLFRDSFGSEVFSQQTQVYALLYNLVDDSERVNVVKYIMDKGRNSEQSFAYYVLYSMFNDNPEWALDYIRKYWGEQMKSPYFNGVWHEAWDVASWKGEVGTTSHAWSSGPTALLPQKVLGIEPLEAGWKTFIVKPNIGNLTWANGIVPSPMGNISVDWNKSKNKFKLNIKVPDKTSATVYVPYSDENYVIVNGKSLYKNQYKRDNNFIELRLNHGTYSIVSKF
ncbi:MAG: alpha-L-rhamnosidase C-terminal domain-containing protein [Melioribacteraceae bacterium]